MKIKYTWLFLLLVGWSSLVRAQILFTATLDTNRIFIGEQTTLTLSASGLSDPSMVNWPAWPDSIASLEVLSVDGDTSKNQSLYTINQRFLITCFDSGFVLIPPFKLMIDTQATTTEPLLLNVSTVPVDSATNYFDIKGPINAPIDWWYWIKRLWLIAAIISVVLAVLIWFWLRHRKREAQPTQPVDTRTPAQRAKDELNALQAEQLWQSGQIKAYYSRATDITRTYLEETFAIAAMEMVTDELLDKIKTKVTYQVFDLLKQSLQTADLVKFAKVIPSPDMHEKIWQACMDVVEHTEPKDDPNAT